MIPAVHIMGPTASGKSALAFEVARRFDAELISVDSAQVFRGLDVGTAKPDARTRAAVPHHLIDILDPTQRYSAAAFAQDAASAIDAVRARGRLPVLVGGTMLYFRALTEGLSELPAADARVRAAIDAEAAQRGWPALHAELARVDPLLAARLAATDAQRIQRALEVHRLTGMPLSQLQGRRRAPIATGPTVAFALLPDRASLHETIEARFDAMLAAGLVDELRALQQRHALEPQMPSMRTVGYRQAWRYLAGACDHDQMRAAGIAATRQLAKRQYTWLRTTAAMALDPADPGTRERVLRAIDAALAG